MGIGHADHHAGRSGAGEQLGGDPGDENLLSWLYNLFLLKQRRLAIVSRERYRGD